MRLRGLALEVFVNLQLAECFLRLITLRPIKNRKDLPKAPQEFLAAVPPVNQLRLLNQGTLRGKHLRICVRIIVCKELLPSKTEVVWMISLSKAH